VIVVSINDLVFSQFSTHRLRHAVECVVNAMPIVVVLETEELSLEIAVIPEKHFVEILAPNRTDEPFEKGM
jgi:hypothetical protein